MLHFLTLYNTVYSTNYKTMGTITAKVKTSLSTDETTLFYNIINLSDQAMVCRFDVSGTQHLWMRIDNMNTYGITLFINTTHTFVSGLHYQDAVQGYYGKQILFDWTGPTYLVWDRDLDWAGTTSCEYTSWAAFVIGSLIYQIIILDTFHELLM